jgi:hypothetical protein
MELKNDHNVYILGAGFSQEAGLPTISDFLVRMRDSHPWLISQGRVKEAEAVQKVLEFRLKAASAAYWTNLDLENIEELFSLASASAEPIAENITQAIAATLDFAAKTAQKEPSLRLFLQNLKWPAPSAWLTNAKHEGHLPTGSVTSAQTGRYPHHVAKLLGMFGDGKPKGENTFITFNYDTVLEDALTELKVPFSYGFKKTWSRDASAKATKDEDALQVLKLHGSLNWARKRVHAWRTSAPRKEFTVFGSYSDVREAGRIPELVPPTWKKIFQGHLGDVWESAVRCLQTATRVIIIGFSMPPADMHFKYLIAAGLQQNVSLRKIAFYSLGMESIEERARSLLRQSYIETGSITFRGCSFGGFVADTNILAGF